MALCCSSGSAGAHYLPALTEAERARVPLIALTADRPPELQACGAPQTMDQRRLFGAHTRFSRDLPVPDAQLEEGVWLSAARQATDAALGPRPGPVHLNCPFREPLWSPGVEVPVERAEGLCVRGVATLPEAALAALADRFAGARGVIHCGPRAAQGPGEAAAIASLARALGWPIFAEATSGLRFGPHDRSACLDTYDALLRTPAFCAAMRPDVALRFGGVATSKPLARFLSSARHLAAVDPGGERLDAQRPVDALIVADPARTARALAQRLRGKPEGWMRSWRSAETKAHALLDREGLWGGSIARAVVDALPEEAVLHLASSMSIREVDCFAPARAKALHVFSNRGVNGIDGTLSSALGEVAALELPGALLIGDLALQHDLGALPLLAARAPKLSVVVLDNGGGGIFSYLPIAANEADFEDCFLSPQEVDLEAVAGGFGLPVCRVRTEAGLREALAQAEGPQVILVSFDREADVAQHHAAWAAVAGASLRPQSPGGLS